jgi:ATP-dependent RNA helicase DeaD
MPAFEIAAALARLHRGDTPLLLPPTRPIPTGARVPRAQRAPRARAARAVRSPKPGRRASAFARPAQREMASDYAFETFRVEVGFAHGVKPGNLVGAIANEAGIDAKHIGRIDIRGDHALIDLPEGMPEELMQHLQQVWVSGQRLRIQRVVGDGGPRPKRSRFVPGEARPPAKPGHRGGAKPGGKPPRKPRPG